MSFSFTQSPSRRLALFLIVIAVPGALSCERGPSGEQDTPQGQRFFTEITAAVGLDKDPPIWPDGRYQISEISPAGIGLFDYDRDGDLDIYQVRHPSPQQPDAPAPNRLLEQKEDGTFVDVTKTARVGDAGYGHGVAVGDVDNDGDWDLYVANLKDDVLYLNNGDGTFTDVTARSGISGALMSTAAAFFDYDRDGDLDLFVCHYVTDDPRRICRAGLSEKRDYCGPNHYRGLPDTLYRNSGDVTFADVTKTSGIRQAWPAFGVICVDLTGDGWVDIYVANDKKPNQLYVNQRNGTFQEEAIARGVALSGEGNAQASMGVAVGDIDSDGRFDLFMTHLVNETNTLYLDLGGRQRMFADKSASTGVGGVSFRFTSWGCGFADFDHDADLDLAVVNGRIARAAVNPKARLGPFWNDYAEPNLLLLNDGRGKFSSPGAADDDFLSGVEVSRGLAFGDLDRDGDIDLVLMNLDNSLRVFRNDAPASGTHWLRIRAITGRRAALGAVISVRAGQQNQKRVLVSTYSYCSANEPVAHFGLGSINQVDAVTVRWPDGMIEEFQVTTVDRELTLVQGEGKE